MIRLSLLAAGLAVVLAGCGNDTATDTGATRFVRVATEQVKARRAAAQAPQIDKAALLTRAELAGITDPLIRIRIGQPSKLSLLFVGAEKNGHQVWFSPDFASLTMRNGVVTGTKGLVGDLVSIDAPATFAALSGAVQQGPSTRVHRRLDGENHLVLDRYECTFSAEGGTSITVLEWSHAVRHVVETCEGPAGPFRNEYWVGSGDGTLWKSRQWLGEKLGEVTLERLIR